MILEYTIGVAIAAKALIQYVNNSGFNGYTTTVNTTTGSGSGNGSGRSSSILDLVSLDSSTLARILPGVIESTIDLPSVVAILLISIILAKDLKVCLQYIL